MSSQHTYPTSFHLQFPFSPTYQDNKLKQKWLLPSVGDGKITRMKTNISLNYPTRLEGSGKLRHKWKRTNCFTALCLALGSFLSYVASVVWFLKAKEDLGNGTITSKSESDIVGTKSPKKYVMFAIKKILQYKIPSHSLINSLNKYYAMNIVS